MATTEEDSKEPFWRLWSSKEAGYRADATGRALSSVEDSIQGDANPERISESIKPEVQSTSSHYWQTHQCRSFYLLCDCINARIYDSSTRLATWTRSAACKAQYGLFKLALLCSTWNIDPDILFREHQRRYDRAVSPSGS